MSKNSKKKRLIVDDHIGVIHFKEYKPNERGNIDVSIKKDTLIIAILKEIFIYSSCVNIDELKGYESSFVVYKHAMANHVNKYMDIEDHWVLQEDEHAPWVDTNDNICEGE